MFSLLRLIVIILVLYFLYQAGRRLFFPGDEGRLKGKKPAKKLGGEDLVEDPQCHMYVPMSRAVAKQVGDRTLYFCSDACHQAYLKDSEKA
jgi:YHS domain-containing protein